MPLEDFAILLCCDQLSLLQIEQHSGISNISHIFHSFFFWKYKKAPKDYVLLGLKTVLEFSLVSMQDSGNCSNGVGGLTLSISNNICSARNTCRCLLFFAIYICTSNKNKRRYMQKEKSSLVAMVRKRLNVRRRRYVQ